MGRLFWKFFLSILLAQVAATIGIGGTIWLRDQARQRSGEPTLDASPPATIMLDAARATLKHAGVDGLRELAATSRRMRLYVLDEQGRELLGRPVPARLREEVERSLTGDGPTWAVTRLSGADGRSYLAFASRAPRPQGPEGMPRGFGIEGAPFAPGMDQQPPGPGMQPGPGVPPGPGMERGGPRGPGGAWLGLPPEFGRHVGRWLPIVAATLASLLFAALLAWYFSRPIRALRSAFEAAAAGDLAPKFAANRPRLIGDELAELGQDFDRMSARLRALMDGQRRLLHDVSHELRSPLARLQAAIGLAHQQPDRIQPTLERIERESVRMDRLVGELLTLSRLEASAQLPAGEAIDLVEMVDQIADDARFESGARIDVDAPTPVTLHGAPDLLWSAVENIVRNAVKHGAGGRVEIGVHPDGAQVHIEVQDQGPGIAEEHLGDVFEPFFRSNPTRNNVDGHGLGMAIAKRVVETHGGRIAAANREAGGMRVTITLPLAQRQPERRAGQRAA
ncbi:HAMP domain-containing sensor histidine kinase [Massilia sp. YIM B02763]|uniref:sensor histidine kinase n=1 Tax=Massilia sp. YIM B02763 TaxID=3050130 RepID=UPI0025B6F952|nr:HAMP domain-containing sensor histidine kinase [Massilia sp. YIM B02763]MDN4054300.1 HAMP domain-containing sensor histidine kinase [Massilia sp. YIM B02763]